MTPPLVLVFVFVFVDVDVDVVVDVDVEVEVAGHPSERTCRRRPAGAPPGPVTFPLARVSIRLEGILMRASARATAAAVVLGIAAGCGSDGYGSSGTPAQCSAGTATALAAGTVTLSGNVFQPACAKVAAGTVVTFANADPVAHTVTADAGGFDHLLGAGQQATQRFAAAGAVGIHCTLHPGMRMTLIVQ